MMIRMPLLLTTAFAGFAMMTAAHAEGVTVGVVLGITGQTASIGIPGRNAVALMPREVAGTPIDFVVLDDGGDPGTAVKNMRQLVEQNKADVILGSASIPACTAMGEVALATKTPQICIAPFATNAFTFTVAQSAPLMVEGLVEDMKAKHYHNIGYIGFADSLGDHNLKALTDLGGPAGIKVVDDERFNRSDTSVTAQVLKVMLAKPDAIFVSASGTPAALPQRELVEHGYKGQDYFLHGVINRDFLRVGGKALDGIIATAGPFAVASSMPDDNPIKKEAVAFEQAYDAKYGAGSANTFASYAWDGFKLVSAALPKALAAGKPGTEAFRVALRDAMENVHGLIGSDAVYTMTPQNHNGVDGRARILVTVEDGAFVPVK